VIVGIHSQIGKGGALQFGDLANCFVYKMGAPPPPEKSFPDHTRVSAEQAGLQSGARDSVLVQEHFLRAVHASGEDKTTRSGISEVAVDGTEILRFDPVIHRVVLGDGIAEAELVGIGVATFDTLVSELGKYFPPN
jgi:hypothetical protein